MGLTYMLSLHFKLLICLSLFILPLSAISAEKNDNHKNSVFFFAGRYSRASLGEAADPFEADYENNYVLGAAYGRNVFEPVLGFSTGPELGLACRFGERITWEIWGGLSFRHRGISLQRLIRVSPGITGGLSLVDRPIGTERLREDRNDGSAVLLFYFSPEIVFVLPDAPQWDMVYRIHHRSGGSGTLGSLKEGHNAGAIGIRYHY